MQMTMNPPEKRPLVCSYCCVDGRAPVSLHCGTGVKVDSTGIRHGKVVLEGEKP
jgi:hypothetical protein